MKGITTVDTKTEFIISNYEVCLEDFDISPCFSEENSNFYAVKFDDVDEKSFKVNKTNIQAFRGSLLLFKNIIASLSSTF